jgi:hypothetical protein
MTVRYSLLSRTATVTVFVISLLLTAATLNSVVIAAAHNGSMVAYATGTITQA